MLFSARGRLHFNLFENDIEHQHRYHPGHTEQRASAERPAVDGELYPRRKPRDVDGEQRRRAAIELSISAEKPRLFVTANTVIASAAAARNIIRTVFIPVDKAIPSFQFVADGYVAAFKSLLLCELQESVVAALERFKLIYCGLDRVVVLAVFKPQICRVHLLFERSYVPRAAAPPLSELRPPF